jgi:chromosome segregation ATPase
MKDQTKQTDALKASKWSAILTLMGFVFLVVAIGYSVVELRQLEKKKAELAQAITENEKQLSTKKTELQQIQGTLEYVRSKVEFANVKSEQIDLAKKALDQLRYDPVEIKPRVYIHVRDKSQVDTALKIADALKKRGFIVPKEEILVDKGPTATEVRYFRESEKPIAEEIFKLLHEILNMKNTKLAYIPGYEASKAISLKHYEIWLSNGS